MELYASTRSNPVGCFAEVSHCTPSFYTTIPCRLQPLRRHLQDILYCGLSNMSLMTCKSARCICIVPPLLTSHLPPLAGGKPVVSLWPNGLARADSIDISKHEQWQLVPDSFDAICDWADVVQDVSQEHVRGLHVVVYNSALLGDGSLACLKRVVVHMQGFVEHIDVGPLGDWNGLVETLVTRLRHLTPVRMVETAPRAIQTLMLTLGGCKEAFAAQMTVIQNLSMFVARTVRATPELPPCLGETIRLRRHVFTRVSWL